MPGPQPSALSRPSRRGHCILCTKHFPYLDIHNPTWGWCTERKEGGEAKGVQCLKCGIVYEFLDNSDCCGLCETYGDWTFLNHICYIPTCPTASGIGAVVSKAIENPPNPKERHPDLSAHVSSRTPTEEVYQFLFLQGLCI